MDHSQRVVAVASIGLALVGTCAVAYAMRNAPLAAQQGPQSRTVQSSKDLVGNAARELRQGRPFDALVLALNESSLSAGADVIKSQAYAQLGGCGSARRWLEQVHDTTVRGTVTSLCPSSSAAPGAANSSLITRLDAPRLRPYAKRPLTDAQREPLDRDSEPASPRYPLRSFPVVTVSPAAERMFAISVSSDVDPRGEISIGGYWLHVSSDRGTRWEGPYYLGLAQQYPFVIERAARGVAFDGERVVLEVERREVDDSRLTLPPVDLRAKGVVERLLLDVDLNAVRRDTDGDGLTDLLEEKLVLDSSAPDTDADGIPDDRDLLPLEPFDARQGPEVGQLWIRLMSEFFDGPEPIQHLASSSGDSGGMIRVPEAFHSQRTLFVAASPCPVPHAAGARAICLSSEALGRYNRKFGVHFALSFPEIVFDHDRRRALIHYDFGWRGGDILATRKGGDWKLQDLGGWIT